MYINKEDDGEKGLESVMGDEGIICQDIKSQKKRKKNQKRLK